MCSSAKGTVWWQGLIKFVHAVYAHPSLRTLVLACDTLLNATLLSIDMIKLSYGLSFSFSNTFSLSVLFVLSTNVTFCCPVKMWMYFFFLAQDRNFADPIIHLSCFPLNRRYLNVCSLFVSSLMMFFFDNLYDSCRPQVFHQSLQSVLESLCVDVVNSSCSD